MDTYTANQATLRGDDAEEEEEAQAQAQPQAQALAPPQPPKVAPPAHRPKLAQCRSRAWPLHRQRLLPSPRLLALKPSVSRPQLSSREQPWKLAALAAR